MNAMQTISKHKNEETSLVVDSYLEVRERSRVERAFDPIKQEARTSRNRDFTGCRELKEQAIRIRNRGQRSRNRDQRSSNRNQKQISELGLLHSLFTQVDLMIRRNTQFDLMI